MEKAVKVGHWKVNKAQLKTWLPTLYYFFFYGALGSLFPFLNLFYRAVGMDPWQIGVLGGIRPLVALFFAPLWSVVADRWKTRKLVLVLSLISWIALTMPLAFVRHSTASEPCPEKSNSSELGLKTNEDFVNNRATIINRFEDISSDDDPLVSSLNDYRENMESDLDNFENLVRINAKIQKTKKSQTRRGGLALLDKPMPHSFGLPAEIELQGPIESKEENSERKPFDFKSRGGSYYNKRKNPKADTIFTEFLIIVFFGEVFQSPTDDINTHYDGTFLEHLGVLYQNAASNNIYSSIGIGVIAFTTGLILRFESKITICDEEYANYKLPFIIFSLLMFAAVVISHKFQFSYRRHRRCFGIKESLKQLITLDHATFLFMVLIMGIFRGVLFNFVYWNIVDIGGSDLVVGMTVVSQHLSDTIVSMSAPILMTYMGYIGMIYLGLASYALRFLIYSWLSTPESAWVTPTIELLQGFSHSTAWSAFLLYITSYTPTFSFPTGIFLLQALYLGVGGSVGSIVCGILIQTFSTNVAFRLFGFVSVFTCLVFMMIQPTGRQETLPSEADTMLFLTDEDDYSSYSEDEIFERKRRAILHLPSEDKGDCSIQPQKVVLPTYSSPLVPFCMSLGKEIHFS
ncbi:major facilitator superfamily domain-containing protein 6-like [Montipora foliosa]|uniref:major facilitator superfamily domain-containing protein 6-like n=1 Tax=Montipora foliosa TaxID=591990 RepID=UPI0035F122CE